ncbi:MAG: class I SAM-dependent methyltransferase [Blastocatellia bacterium]
MQTTSTSEWTTLKNRMKAIWMSGDYSKIARIIEPGAEAFIERLCLRPGTRVLDVACGTGNICFPAARAGAMVTGLDIAPNLLATARKRARAAGARIQFDEGDVEQMPYPDATFDVVVSMFGAMFAPQPQITAAELLRVCRPGGLVAMANWTPAGFIGQMFRITAMHVPPPPIPSTLLWGDEATVRARFANAAGLRMRRQTISFPLSLTPGKTVEYFRAWYGPTLRSFAALDPDGQAALRRDLTQLWTEHNQATDGTTHVDSEYLEVILQKENADDGRQAA